jgi:Fic family protein
VKPPYDISPAILKLVASISEKIGEVNARYLVKTNPELRKQNRIKTIHSSLQIEGNTLSEEKITAIIENKRVTGPEKDIREVLNAVEVYRQMSKLNYTSEKDFLKAHQLLMQELVERPGKYRKKGVGIVKGSNVQHIAPPFENVPYLMKDLFAYLKDKQELTLIKSCVFHYEMEFIHPFMDGNGRMGRLWQTLILMNEYPVFEFLPFETLISKNQAAYYRSLSASDKEGKSTCFVAYMLGIIDHSFTEMLEQSVKKLSEADRIRIFLENTDREFTRKDYLSYFKDISTATASRDLKKATDLQLIEKTGDKKLATYLRKAR